MLNQKDEDFINSQAIPWEEEKMDFLPKDYQKPITSSNYMKLSEAKNKFRILGSAIAGYEWWTESNGARIPHRVKTWEEAVEQGVEPFKHFWAFPVYNYQERRIQIMELTQKTVKDGIQALIDDPDWHDVKDFDITVNKVGEGKETRYTGVTPSPKNPIDPKIVEKFEEMDIKVEKLYKNEDPFIKEE